MTHGDLVLNGTPTEESIPKEPKKKPFWRGILSVGLIALFCALLVCGAVLFGMYRSVRPIVTVELGDMTPRADVFVRSGGEAAYAQEPELRYPVGSYPLTVSVEGRQRRVLLRVRDTIPPAAEGAETTVSTKASPTPDRLLKHITDESVVRITYERAPQYGTVGDYTAIVRMEDESGNVTRVPVRVHIRIVRDAVECEAGDPAPDASAFLIDEYRVLDSTEITEEMMRTPGVYPVALTLEGETAESRLIVRDTVPPQAKSVTEIVAPDAELKPEDLVADVRDETAVTVSFVNEPDREVRGAQTVEIELCDAGKNRTVIESQVLFTSLPPIRVEARRSILTASECLEEGSFSEATLKEPFIPNVPGTHLVPITVDGQEDLVIIEVTDTEAPLLRVRKTVWFLDNPKDASFFAAAEDATATVLRFETEPDWTLAAQDVTLIARDAGGNEASETFTLWLNPDLTPPIIYGARDRYSYVNEPVAYMKDISAEDECDGEAQVTVDTSKVDPSRTGTYPVTYTATDRAGNAVSKTVKFTFIEAQVTEEEAEAVAQEILKKVLKDGMTLGEQVEALYDYVFRHVRYVGTSNKKDWRSEAVRGLTTGKGDCFTSYACLRLLLEHTGAELMSVERYGSRTHHYWMLVNVGSGWYHVDASNTGKAKKRCFMWTNAQKNKVSKAFWRYNETLYPPIATEPYKKGK